MGDLSKTGLVGIEGSFLIAITNLTWGHIFVDVEDWDASQGLTCLDKNPSLMGNSLHRVSKTPPHLTTSIVERLSANLSRGLRMKR